MMSSIAFLILAGLVLFVFVSSLVFPSKGYIAWVRQNNRLQRDKHASQPKDTPAGKTLLYVDYKGNKWYEFTDLLQMCNKRHLQLMVSNRYMEMNITKPRLKEAIEKVLQYYGTDKSGEALKIISELHVRLDLIGERETFIDSIALCYLLNDEPIQGLDEALHEKKKRLIAEDDALFSFFLRNYLIRLRGLQEAYATDLQNYFRRGAYAKILNVLNRF